MSDQPETVPTRTAPLNDLAAAIYGNARDHGFWDDGERNFAEMLMLVTSELAEALEEHRAGRPNVYHSIIVSRMRMSASASSTATPSGLALTPVYVSPSPVRLGRPVRAAGVHDWVDATRVDDGAGGGGGAMT